MATVRKLASGKWNAQVRRKGHSPISKSFINQKDAIQWVRLIESDMDKGVFLDRSEAETTTLADALERYQKEVTPHKKGADRESDRLSVWLLNPLAKRSLSSLKAKDFAQYRDVRLKEVSSNTVRLELAIVSHLFTIALKEWGIPVLNPLSGIRKPKPSNSRTRRLEGDEEDRLLKACKGSRNVLLYSLVVVAIETGMRLSELFRMTWQDVDLIKRLVYLSDTKNGDSRAIPLSLRAVDTLTKIPRNISNSRVFYVWPMKPDAISGAWKPALERAGITGLHFHDLRHEAASRLFEKGLNVMEVASITGHKTLQMLKRYTHLRAESLLVKLDAVAVA